MDEQVTIMATLFNNTAAVEAEFAEENWKDKTGDGGLEELAEQSYRDDGSRTTCCQETF